jgi:type I restriction enzyme S subunit
MDATITTELGVFPSDWRVDRFDSLFDVQQGRQVSKKSRIGENQQPFLRTKNVFWNRLDLADLDEMHFSEAEETRLALKPDDLLICEGGDIGRTAIWRGAISNCYYQNHLHRARIRTPEAADAQFILFWLWYAFEFGNLYFGRGNVTTIPNLSQSRLCELPLAIPPLPEQRKIAGVLGLVQRAMEQQERLIALTAELKKALLHQLFTQGLRGEPQKQTEIGPVPQSWEVVTIGDLFKFSSGKSRPDDTELTASESRPFPVFGGNGVLGYSSRYLVEEPLLLIGRVGEYCGCAHHTAGRAWVSDNALYAKEILRETNTRYAAEYFSYANLNQYRNQAGQPLITQGVISKVRMPLPPIDQQREILEPLTLLNQKLSVSKRKHAALTVLFRTLLHQLMTAQIRVDKLDIEELNVGIS